MIRVDKIWLAARRLNEGVFNWPKPGQKRIELTDEQLQALVIGLPWHRLGEAAVLAYKDKTIKELELTNSQLKHELAVIRRYRFGQKSEQYSGAQGWLFEEDAQADLVAIENELDVLNKTPAPKTKAPARPKRRALPPKLPRVEIYHEPENLQCNCGCALKRIGEDMTEKLDYIITINKRIL